MLPLFQNTLEDIVYEVLNEREIPNRTQFSEVRDVVNNLRGPVSSATSAIKKLEKRITDLERRVDELQSP
jgi:polyhydroxyalkanoate synthesis regulator phasin